MPGKSFFADRSPIAETSGKVHKITTAAELETLLSSTKHVVVDFYADWCPPCRAIAPVFSELAENNAEPGQLAFAKVNVDNVSNVSGRYGVSAMPTFLIFNDGAPKGVAVADLKPRQSVIFNSTGLVERILGADRAALQAVVRALAGPVSSGGGESGSDGKMRKE